MRFERANSQIEDNNFDVKLGDINYCCRRYGLGRNSMAKYAELAGAVCRLGGKTWRVNIPVMDRYIDEITEQQNQQQDQQQAQ